MVGGPSVPVPTQVPRGLTSVTLEKRQRLDESWSTGEGVFTTRPQETRVTGRPFLRPQGFRTGRREGGV